MGLFERAGRKPCKIKTACSFQQWAEQNGFARCGLFEKSGTTVSLTHSFGMDAETVFSSVSTEDFWRGLELPVEWKSIFCGDRDFPLFAQFLSKKVRCSAETIHILKLPESCLRFFFLYDCPPPGMTPQEITSSLSEILKNHSEKIFEYPAEEKISGLTGSRKAALFTVFLDKALDEISEGTDKGISQSLRNTVFEETAFVTNRIFTWPDFSYSKSPEYINIAAVISDENDGTEIKKRLCKEYEEILGKTAAQKISVTDRGRASESGGILCHLLRGPE